MRHAEFRRVAGEKNDGPAGEISTGVHILSRSSAAGCPKIRILADHNAAAAAAAVDVPAEALPLSGNPSPYDPVYNYTAPRPQYLFYDPNRNLKIRRRIERLEKKMTSCRSNSSQEKEILAEGRKRKNASGCGKISCFLSGLLLGYFIFGICMVGFYPKTSSFLEIWVKNAEREFNLEENEFKMVSTFNGYEVAQVESKELSHSWGSELSLVTANGLADEIAMGRNETLSFEFKHFNGYEVAIGTIDDGSNISRLESKVATGRNEILGFEAKGREDNLNLAHNHLNLGHCGDQHESEIATGRSETVCFEFKQLEDDLNLTQDRSQAENRQFYSMDLVQHQDLLFLPLRYCGTCPVLAMHVPPKLTESYIQKIQPIGKYQIICSLTVPLVLLVVLYMLLQSLTCKRSKKEDDLVNLMVENSDDKTTRLPIIADDSNYSRRPPIVKQLGEFSIADTVISRGEKKSLSPSPRIFDTPLSKPLSKEGSRTHSSGKRKQDVRKIKDHDKVMTSPVRRSSRLLNRRSPA